MPTPLLHTNLKCGTQALSSAGVPGLIKHAESCLGQLLARLQPSKASSSASAAEPPEPSTVNAAAALLQVSPESAQALAHSPAGQHSTL